MGKRKEERGNEKREGTKEKNEEREKERREKNARDPRLFRINVKNDSLSIIRVSGLSITIYPTVSDGRK